MRFREIWKKNELMNLKIETETRKKTISIFQHDLFFSATSSLGPSLLRHFENLWGESPGNMVGSRLVFWGVIGRSRDSREKHSLITLSSHLIQALNACSQFKHVHNHIFQYSCPI